MARFRNNNRRRTGTNAGVLALILLSIAAFLFSLNYWPGPTPGHLPARELLHHYVRSAVHSGQVEAAPTAEPTLFPTSIVTEELTSDPTVDSLEPALEPTLAPTGEVVESLSQASSMVPTATSEDIDNDVVDILQASKDKELQEPCDFPSIEGWAPKDSVSPTKLRVWTTAYDTDGEY